MDLFAKEGMGGVVSPETHGNSLGTDTVADPWTTGDQKGARNAHEKDAYKFANDHD